MVEVEVEVVQKKVLIAKEHKNASFKLYNMETIKILYNALISDRSKERFEMILEPLQAISQLAFLSYCPVGSKLSISDNILYIQEPGWGQTISRSYYLDKKEDLIYLFGVIKRFHSFYGFLQSGKGEKLFDDLINLSKSGIEKLIQTYNKSDSSHLTQTLRMYKSMIDKPDAFDMQEETEKEGKQTDIDEVFKKVVKLYKVSHYAILKHTLVLLKHNPACYRDYIDGYNKIMLDINNQMKKWISDNIIF